MVSHAPIAPASACPETITGNYLWLADFEETSTRSAAEQVKYFWVESDAEEDRIFLVSDRAHTGEGAAKIILSPGGRLFFSASVRPSEATFTLLSMAIYSEVFRDDLCLTVTFGGKERRFPPSLIEPGWNIVLFDIRSLRPSGFEPSVEIELVVEFSDAAGAMEIGLDDLMLIDNVRELTDTPEGIRVARNGLDYVLSIQGWDFPIALRQGEDGLWRLSEGRINLQIFGEGDSPANSGDSLDLLGERKIGQIEVLECNPIRVRLANRWYFPSRGGEWRSLSVQKIIWKQTFYGDGRWVSSVELNNAGEQEIRAVRLTSREPTAWSGRSITRELFEDTFSGPVRQWSALRAIKSPAGDKALRNYLLPGRVEIRLGEDGNFVSGDKNRDHFDESQACYYFRSASRNGRFAWFPPEGGERDPVFRVAGLDAGEVIVTCQGRAVHEVIRLEDASILFQLPGDFELPVEVEISVSGKFPSGR
jgi:hypothetical protein